MPTTSVMLVMGTRPQFIKSAPVIAEFARNHKRISLTVVHSGQHYDREMSAIFFRELQIPRPSLNLRAGSGSHAEQTATIMTRLESAISRIRPDLVLVPGDTNTTLAAALTAAKLGIPVAHIEAGLRSGDITMPEEINRKMTDHCSSLLFAPTKTALINLEHEGLRKITQLTGDTMVDALYATMPYVEKKQHALMQRMQLAEGAYALVTMHRPSNVDDPRRLRAIYRVLCKLATRKPIVFLVHPRTRARLARLGATPTGLPKSLILKRPQGYVETLALLKNARCLLTDSGGMQKEAFLLKVKCVTLRSTTEWPETLSKGANQLVMNPTMLHEATRRIFSDREIEGVEYASNPFGDGHAAERIARLVKNATT